VIHSEHGLRHGALHLRSTRPAGCRKALLAEGTPTRANGVRERNRRRPEADALVLVLLTMGGDDAATTANLLAPVVVNARTRKAAQVILSGSDWPVRAAVA